MLLERITVDGLVVIDRSFAMSFQKFAGFSPIALLFIGFAAFCISAANAAQLEVLEFVDMGCRAWTQGSAV